MPYTMEDFEREVQEDVLKKLTPEQRLRGMSPKELLACVSERLQGLTPEELLSHIPLAEIEKYLKLHKETSPKPKSDAK